MSHRSGKAFRKGFARDHRLLLVLGVVLVVAALVMSTCEGPGDLLGGAPSLAGGEQQ